MAIYLNKVFSIIVLFVLVQIICETTPGKLQNNCIYKPNDSSYGIQCTKGTKEVDIEDVFNKLEEEIPKYDRYFLDLTWTIPIKDGILPANVFKSFVFEIIHMNSPNLKKIHQDAFGNYTTDLFFEEKSKLKNYPGTEYDLYEAFSRVSNLNHVRLNLDNDQEHEIPDDAFKNSKWKSFFMINFQGKFNISRIGNNLINYMPDDISGVNFEQQIIKSISPNAFKLDHGHVRSNTTDNFYLFFDDNKLNDNNFKQGVFDMGSYPVTLNLQWNMVTLLKEEIFRPFLENNEKNVLKVSGNPLKCTQETKPHFQWLLNHTEYKDRVKEAYCSGYGSQTIWEYDWNGTTSLAGPQTISIIFVIIMFFSNLFN